MPVNPFVSNVLAVLVTVSSCLQISAVRGDPQPVRIVSHAYRSPRSGAQTAPSAEDPLFESNHGAYSGNSGAGNVPYLHPSLQRDQHSNAHSNGKDHELGKSSRSPYVDQNYQNLRQLQRQQQIQQQQLYQQQGLQGLPGFQGLQGQGGFQGFGGQAGYDPYAQNAFGAGAGLGNAQQAQLLRQQLLQQQGYQQNIDPFAVTGANSAAQQQELLQQQIQQQLLGQQQRPLAGQQQFLQYPQQSQFGGYQNGQQSHQLLLQQEQLRQQQLLQQLLLGGAQGQQRPGYPQQQLQQLFGAGYSIAGAGLGGIGSTFGYGQQSLNSLQGQPSNFNNLNLVNPLLLRRQYRYGRREGNSNNAANLHSAQQQREVSRHHTWTNKGRESYQ